jgi:hypothetical protein
MQGNWGELGKSIGKSGLEKDANNEVQQSFTGMKETVFS